MKNKSKERKKCCDNCRFIKGRKFCFLIGVSNTKLLYDGKYWNTNTDKCSRHERAKKE